MSQTQHAERYDPERIEDIAQKVLHLFSANDFEAEMEKEFDTRVFDLVQAFLRNREINTAIDQEQLSGLFRQTSIADDPVPLEQYLGYLREYVVKHSTNVSSPRFVGHMTTALPYFIRPLSMLVTGLNQNPVKIETAKSLTPFEREVLAKLHHLVYRFDKDFYEHHVQNRDSTLGAITSGGTLANVTAIWCARNVALGARGSFAGVEEEGMLAALKHYGYEGAVIVGARTMHYSLEKAVGLMGLGRRGLKTVALDKYHRIDLVKTREAIAEARSRKLCILALVGVAGTTDGGSVDPLDALADLAAEEKLHYHVDAAWGGPILFSERHRKLLKGIERADSVTLDGHKQVYCPMGVGGVLFKNPYTAKAIEKTAQYVVRETSADLGRRALEGSRPGMSIYLHAALSLLGKKGFGYLIDEGIRKIRYLADKVSVRPEFELMQQPEINILLYRYLPEAIRSKAKPGTLTPEDQLFANRFNQELQRAQRQAGHTFISRTSVDERFGCNPPIVVLRAVIANPLTTEADIDAVLEEQLRIARMLEQNMPASD